MTTPEELEDMADEFYKYLGPEWDWDVSDDMRSDLLGCQ